ncbi:MAG: hypothetical protein G01um101448_1108 [Parcubacteria group bacterium Gr01-1014_48]|nr:MAG: hypothetical protein G01um101448_1108 [Parcubacteria group bacterium Gr01-1014_48]
MDSPFKSSFIPKRSLEEQLPRRKSRTIGFLTLFVVIIFLTAVGFAGGVLLYQSYIKKDIANMHDELIRARQSLNPTRIEELRRLDTRIREARNRLDAHTAPTLLFKLLEANTLQNVRYRSFEYETLEDGVVHVVIDGQARNFSAVALQSDQLSEDKNILNPIFNDLNPNEEGFVDFTVDGSVAPDFIDYGNSLGFEKIETPDPIHDVFNDETGAFDVFGSGASVTGQDGNSAATTTGEPTSKPKAKPKPKATLP